EEHDPARKAVFTVADASSDEPLGACLLWGIDHFNRAAHIGLSLRPVARGRGLATETLRLLSGYGFDILGLQRLAIETLSDNEPMIRAAQRAGFTREGTLRQAGWVNGRWRDEAIFGLLADEWRRDRPDPGPGSAAAPARP
ncbi:MAG TPA: GNAT family protein, partial [Jatrophihabitans sp.]|nr:GNAT family protein [Jatrophihabitans sp.]